MRIPPFLSFLISFLLFSLIQISAAENLVKFSIDKNIYENMSNPERKSLISRTQFIMDFIDRDLLPKIRAPILEKLKGLKITISFTNESGRDGLFIPQEDGNHLILIQQIYLHSNGIKSLIAHEIYHSIHYHLNPDELPWIREGMAQVFEYITTQDLNAMNLMAAINTPFTPLISSYDPNKSNPAQYGHDMLYFYYLYKQCGEDELFWKLTLGNNQKNLHGTKLIDEVLSQLNHSQLHCSNFAESSLTFEVAKLHNQLQFSNSKEQQKYFVFPGNISPLFNKLSTKEDLKKTIEAIPVLSSYKISLKDYQKLEGNCQNCALFYSQSKFPYTVSEKMPSKLEGIDVILVKIN